jgi:hypothetical protein
MKHLDVVCWNCQTKLNIDYNHNETLTIICPCCGIELPNLTEVIDNG